MSIVPILLFGLSGPRYQNTSQISSGGASTSNEKSVLAWASEGTVAQWPVTRWTWRIRSARPRREHPDRTARAASALTSRATSSPRWRLLNPGGSVKDRPAVAMIDAAERDGLLQAGRHDRRADLGQHRRRPRHRRRPARLPMHLRDVRQDERREGRVAAAYGAEVVVCPTAVPPEHPDSYLLHGRAPQQYVVLSGAPGSVASLRAAAADAGRGRPAVVGDPLGAAGHREDHAGPGHRRPHQQGVRAAQRGERRREGRARRARAGPAPPRRARPGHDPVPRRGAPLQQGAAGRAAARRRERAHHAHRRHHREPVLRGEPAAAQPVHAVPAPRRSTTTPPARCSSGASRPRAPPPSDDALEHLAGHANGDGRHVLTSLEVAVAIARARAAAARRSRSPTPRRPSAPRRCATAATSTTTSSPPSSRASAAPIPTPASTGWPACSRRARTPASSPAAWSSWPARTSARPTRRRSSVAVAAAHAVEHVGPARGAAQPGPGRRPPRHRAQVEPQRARHLAARSRTCATARRWRCRSTSATPTTRRAAKLGHGAGYDYPHDDPEGWVPQPYLPDELGDRTYYDPSPHGFEQEIRTRMERRNRG